LTPAPSRLDGCVVNVEAAAENPGANVQAPLAVVQAAKPTDLITVADGTVKLNKYVVLALAADEPIVTFRAVI
jgi:hypothetical protein